MPPPTDFSFEAVAHFIVVPDRHYRIEVRDGKLYLLKIGSQFDLEHPGSLNRFRMTDSPAQPAAKSPSRRVLILGGIGTIVGSIVLFVILLKAGVVTTKPVFLMAFGFVLLIAGFVTPNCPYVTDTTNPDSAVASHPHNFVVPCSEILRANLAIPQGPTQAARLQIQMISGKKINLLIRTPDDLATVQNYLVPTLGQKVTVL